MPIFFQQDIDQDTRLAIWKIEEDEAFFLQHVPLQREITHPHKRLQHLAGRYLLQYLFPDFPISLIKIADTRKPFLEDEVYHFSISHCSQYAAAIVSSRQRVGVDIEVPSPKVEKIKHKFLSREESEMLNGEWLVVRSELSVVSSEWPVVNESGVINDTTLPATNSNRKHASGSLSTMQKLTLLWSAKEAMFKWWGLGDVDFRTMLHVQATKKNDSTALTGRFTKDERDLSFPVMWQKIDGLLLAWIATEVG